MVCSLLSNMERDLFAKPSKIGLVDCILRLSCFKEICFELKTIIISKNLDENLGTYTYLDKSKFELNILIQFYKPRLVTTLR